MCVCVLLHKAGPQDWRLSRLQQQQQQQQLKEEHEALCGSVRSRSHFRGSELKLSEASGPTGFSFFYFCSSSCEKVSFMVPPSSSSCSLCLFSSIELLRVSERNKKYLILSYSDSVALLCCSIRCSLVVFCCLSRVVLVQLVHKVVNTDYQSLY